jgi:AcrR family transcriptional regulator
MPRPRSDDKRAAIMAAATRVIAAQGLGAATAVIAKEAGVSNGSLFTYFDTKSDLFNQLYLELKAEMAAAASAGLAGDAGLAADSDLRAQLWRMWSGWLRWAAAVPDRRRTLAQLDVSDEITPSTHRAASEGMTGVAALLERSRETGPLRDSPLPFVLALANSLAEATIDFVISDPGHADAHSRAAFDALWRMLA